MRSDGRSMRVSRTPREPRPTSMRWRSPPTIADDLRMRVAEFVALGDVENLDALLANILGLAGVDRARALAAERRREPA